MKKNRVPKNVSPDVAALNPELFDAQEGKKNKYGAHRIEVDGISFDSKKEARRYLQLRAMEEAGEIHNLRRQVRYTLLESFTDTQKRRHRAITYTADMVYDQDGVTYIEDTKSPATAKNTAFRLRWKLLCYMFKDDPYTIPVIHGG